MGGKGGRGVPPPKEDTQCKLTYLVIEYDASATKRKKKKYQKKKDRGR